MLFSAALFAGGQSSRMGRDKAFLEINGAPLWRNQLEILRALNPSELFISGHCRPEWSESDIQIVPDVQENAGPLSGLVAVLRRCRSPWLLTLAIDLPKMTTRYLESLLSESESEKGVVPRMGERFEPLVAIYPVALLPMAESFLSSGKLSLQEFVACAIHEELMVTKNVSSVDESLFLNLNTPEEFAHYFTTFESRRNE